MLRDVNETVISLVKLSSTSCDLSFCHFLSHCLLASVTVDNRILLSWDTAVLHCVCECLCVCASACEQNYSGLHVVFGLLIFVYVLCVR